MLKLTTLTSSYEWIIISKCWVGGIYPDNHLGGDIKSISIHLKDRVSEIEIDGQFSWIKCNRGFSGYYLTQYSPANYEAVGKALYLMTNSFDYFESGDRADLINSAFSVAYAGTGTYYSVAALTLYMGFEYETQYVPWKVFAYHSNKVANLLEHRKTFPGFADFVLETSKPTLNLLNSWNETGSNQNDKLLRRTLVDLHCRMQEYSCLREASRQFESIPEDYFEKPSQIENGVSANLRSLAYKYHIQNSNDPNDWLKVLSLYSAMEQVQEKLSALDALSFTRLAWTLDEHLQGLFANTYRPGDFFRIINNVARNPSGRHFAWNFLRANWRDIYIKFGSVNGIISSTRVFAESFEIEFLYQEAYEFLENITDSAVALSPAQKSSVLNAIRSNIFWMTESERDLIESIIEK